MRGNPLPLILLLLETAMSCKNRCLNEKNRVLDSSPVCNLQRADRKRQLAKKYSVQVWISPKWLLSLKYQHLLIFFRYDHDSNHGTRVGQYQDNKTKRFNKSPQTSNQRKACDRPKKGEFCKKNPSFGTHDWPNRKLNLGRSYVVVSFGMQVEVMMQVDMLLFSFVNATKFLCFPWTKIVHISLFMDLWSTP